MFPCPFCRAEILDPPLLADVAAQLTAFPTARAMLWYVEKHHPDWPKLYRTVTDADGRRRIRRFILASQAQTLVKDTFRSTIRRDGRPKQPKSAPVGDARATDASVAARGTEPA